ncbi:hypothetical protein [Qipengyuania sediminis]|uniref:hypothetical protein n=1 Tax=Qipengyuania sediminis TaxID=1532023 RepID=UPI00105AA58C|nr:hypothetical protein [Qipengyuania sediminis]
MFLLPMVVANAMTVPPAEASSPIAQSAMLADLLSGPELALTMRGATVTVRARAISVEAGCAARLAAEVPGRGEVFTRLLRWSELAWAGAAEDGQVRIAFYDHEGRLPVDTLTFAPADAARFQAALAAVVSTCRGMPESAPRVMTYSHAAGRSCYFAGLPQLQLLDAAAGAFPAQPSRALLTLLARERPEAEMQVLMERPGADGPAGAEPDVFERASVAFVYAGERVTELAVAEAGFALDAITLPAPHTIAVYGDTRIRITLTNELAGRLTAGKEVKLILRDGARQERAAVHFDAGPALEAARRALAAADWSCAEAASQPPAAARWIAAR